jgi:hypothetical protein
MGRGILFDCGEEIFHDPMNQTAFTRKFLGNLNPTQDFKNPMNQRIPIFGYLYVISPGLVHVEVINSQTTVDSRQISVTFFYKERFIF